LAIHLHIVGVPGIPEVTAGADLSKVIVDALARGGLTLEEGDVIVIAQKLVSKAEGALIALSDVRPSPPASEWAATFGKDASVVEVILRESRRIVRMERGIIISETRHGFVCANAGVDASNVPAGWVSVLPRDPDASAERIRAGLTTATGVRVGAIVSDTFGRPWREGTVNVALGVAGLAALADWRGRTDAHGRVLQSTIVAIADEIASAAELVMGKTAQMPAAVVRGAGEWLGSGTGRELLRPASLDLFR
jgi:coenzyme F420-0:L-glutamate ligase / coenzyme F420-1:gamma-L-glutamate ligase